jgi:subtilase family serine protease
MRKRLGKVPRRAAVAAIGVLVCAALIGGGSAARADSPAANAVCGAAAPGYARCFALRVAGISSPAVSPNLPAGYGPADLQSAYSLPSSTNGAGQTVGIVDAFDDPTAESDLGQYRSTYGLPACTTANGCFKKVNQTGGTTYPPVNTGWDEEISLDLDMVSAICPNCHILLVEATSNSFANLDTAENEAVTLGANEVSNSWGGGEFSGETALDVFFNHPGVAITASTGDDGYGVQYPAASPDVTAVGGTSLTKTKKGKWKQTAWSGAGSGCSSQESKPAWQHDTGCSRRTVADVSAVADPHTGVAVDYNGTFLVFGGTSVSSPIIASVYALAGNASTVNYGSYPYLHDTKANITDVKKGSNGSCGGSYLCTAKKGYDGPTGLGTPKGVGGF